MPVVDEHRIGNHIATILLKQPGAWRAGRATTSQKLAAACKLDLHRHASACEHRRRDLLALGALKPVWDELYLAEQARILRLLIERIDVAPDGISVTLHAAGIRSLVAELAEQEALALAEPEPLLEAAEY
jgi:hypothetical protein